MKYGFIGLGNMATAIAKGMYGSGDFSDDSILGYDISGARLTALSDEIKLIPTANAADLADRADVVILAVKPQVTESVFAEIRGHLTNKLVISIAAGKTLEFLENGLGSDAAIIRVMPNINAMVGAATSAYVCNSNVSASQKNTVEHIFSTIGTVTELPEKLFSAFTAIGGSSPAFAYIYIDALARAGVQHGLSKEQALKIAASTVYGSAKMVLESGVHPMELCDRVCSPAGTTIDGVMRLQANGFEAAIHDAITAVVKKDKSL